MNKTIAGAGAVILIAIIAIVLAVSGNTSDTMMADGQKDAMMKEGAEGVSGDAMMQKDTKADAMMKEDNTDAMKKDDAMMKNDTMKKDDAAMMQKESMSTHGSFVAYSPEALAAVKSGNVVLFFYAPWCLICRGIESDIQANMNAVPSNLTIMKVDFDTATELRKKYGVTLQHTFVQVRADGTAVSKWSDSRSLSSLVAKVQ